MIKILGWKYYGHNVVWGYEKNIKTKNDATFGAYPEIVFSIKFKRFGFNSIFTLILPLIFMFFICIFGFSLLGRIGALSFVISTMLSCIGSLFLYRFVIDKITPKTGQLVFVDFLYIFVLVCIFLQFILTVCFHKQIDTPFFIKIRIFVVSIFQMSLIFLFYDLLFAR